MEKEVVLKWITLQTKLNGDNNAEITSETRLYEDLGLDSLDIVDIFNNIEGNLKALGIHKRIRLEPDQKGLTVGDVVKAVKE